QRNVSAHSEGGRDARYVMGVRPDLIASVTTVSTPHLGADLADFLAANLAGNGFNQTVVSLFGNTLGTIIDLFTGMPSQQDAIGALHSLSSAGAAGLTQQFPAAAA